MSMEEYMDLEEQIDAERERVSVSGKKVNDATFKEWKERRDELRSKQKTEDATKKKALTGIQLFRKQGNLFKDDENATGDVIKVDELNQMEEEVKQVKTDSKLNLKIFFRKFLNLKFYFNLEEIIEDLENQLNGVKINTELFSGENLDDLDDVDDENIDYGDEENNDIEEESKAN